MKKIKESDVLRRLGLEKGRYFLLSAHREENIDHDNNCFSLMTAINIIAEHYEMPVIYSTHPRSRLKIDEKNFKFYSLIKNIEPLGFFGYNNLQIDSYCVLSDSSALSEESAMMDFPTVLIRTSPERPEVLGKGTMVIGGIKEAA